MRLSSSEDCANFTFRLVYSVDLGRAWPRDAFASFWLSPLPHAEKTATNGAYKSKVLSKDGFHFVSVDLTSALRREGMKENLNLTTFTLLSLYKLLYLSTEEREGKSLEKRKQHGMLMGHHCN